MNYREAAVAFRLRELADQLEAGTVEFLDSNEGRDITTGWRRLTIEYRQVDTAPAHAVED